MTNAKRIFSFLVLFMVLASPCFATTYYVRAVGGDNGNAGTSFAAAWATIQHAADTATAGDLVLICADSTHTQTARVDFDTNAGTAIAPIVFRGASSTGSDDGTVAIISGTGLPATTDLFSFTIATFVTFQNLSLCYAKRDALTTTTSNVFLTFKKCSISNSSRHAAYHFATSGGFLFLDSKINNNAGDGLGGGSGGGRGGLIRCCVYNNSGSGYNGALTKDARIENTFFYNNGVGISVSKSDADSYRYAVIDSCTIYGNISGGVVWPSSQSDFAIIKDTIIANNGGYGIDTNGTLSTTSLILSNVNSYGNTSGHIDINGGFLFGEGIITTDPNFVSTTAGSEDFTPQNSDLSFETAFPSGGSTYAYIGAIQPQPSSGGGTAAGPLVGPGRLVR